MSSKLFNYIINHFLTLYFRKIIMKFKSNTFQTILKITKYFYILSYRYTLILRKLVFINLYINYIFCYTVLVLAIFYTRNKIFDDNFWWIYLQRIYFNYLFQVIIQLHSIQQMYLHLMLDIDIKNIIIQIYIYYSIEIIEVSIINT